MYRNNDTGLDSQVSRKTLVPWRARVRVQAQGKLGKELGKGLGKGLGLEEVFVFDSKSENEDRAVEVRVRVRVRYQLLTN